MAKMFDKVSDSFLDAIKSVTEKKLTPAEMKKREEVAKAIERDNPDMPMDKKMAIATATAKKVAEAKLDPVDHKALKGSHADRKDKDIDNDGDVDTSDEYLHNRRKAVKHAIAKKMKEEADYLETDLKKRKKNNEKALKDMKDMAPHMKNPALGEEVEQIDEISPAMKSRYKTKARGDLEAAQSFQADLKHEGEPKSSRVSKDVAQIIKKRKTGLKRVGEEVEQVDEISKATMGRYINKAKDSIDMASYRSGIKDGTAISSSTPYKSNNPLEKKLSKRHKGIETAVKKLTREEAEQIDEISTKLAIDYSAKAADARGHRKLSTAKLDKRYKSMALAHEKIRARHAQVPTTEEAEQIDELSKKTLGSYVKKSAGQAAGSAAAIAAIASSSKGKAPEKRYRNLRNRLTGISKATDRLTKEEVELTPEEIAMIEAKMAGVAAGALPGDEHMCATKIFKEGLGEGQPIHGEHAEPDENGNIEWYDVLFDEGIERVYVAEEGVEILSEMSHGNHKKMKEEIDSDLESELKARRQTKKSLAAAKERRQAFSRANNLRDIAKYANEEAEITEARGRPRKENKDFTIHPKTKEKLMHNNPAHMARIEKLQKTGALAKPKVEAGQNIITQLRKASTSMTGGMKVNFTHGATTHVSGAHAQKLLDKHAGMKPSEKESFQKAIGHSHAQLMKHV